MIINITLLSYMLTQMMNVQYILKDFCPIKIYKHSSLILEMMLHHHQELKMKKSQPLKIMSIIMMITQQPSILEMVGNIK